VSAVDSRSENPPSACLLTATIATRLLNTHEVDKHRSQTPEKVGGDHMKLVSRLVILVFAGALLAGCGAFQKTAACPPPTAEPVASPSASMTPTTAPSSAPPRERYSFSLGLGDRSAAGQWPDQFVYEALAARQCGRAQEIMKRRDKKDNIPGWGDFDDPRQILLFQAGLELCLNNANTARKWYDRVKSHWGGWNGIGWIDYYEDTLSWHTCEMYRSVASVMEQKPASSIRCVFTDDYPKPVQNWMGSDTDDRVDPRS